MFIEINEKIYSAYYIQTAEKVDEVVVDDQNNSTTIYKIVYYIVNGSCVEESFNDETERNDKYDSLLS